MPLFCEAKETRCPLCPKNGLPGRHTLENLARVFALQQHTLYDACRMEIQLAIGASENAQYKKRKTRKRD